MGPIEVVELDAVIPYWRNPRTIPDDAVNAVAESIRRYGLQQPIVVDSNSVIIIGHTRYSALRRLGFTKVPVRQATDLSPTQVRELRVIDNRTHEYSSWDFEKLTGELSDLDIALMQAFFPEAGVIGDPGAGSDSDYYLEPADPGSDSRIVREVEFVCPSCFHTWEMPVSKAQVATGLLDVSSAPPVTATATQIAGARA